MRKIQEFISKKIIDYFKVIPEHTVIKHNISMKEIIKRVKPHVPELLGLLYVTPLVIVFVYSLIPFINHPVFFKLSYINRLCSILTCLFIFFIVLAYGFKLYAIAIKYIFALTHSLLKGKEDRSREIISHWEKELSLYSLTDEILRDYEKLGIKEFCLKYFQKKAPGFINFIDERAKKDSYFLLYALSIPRHKELSVDSFRKILLCTPTHIDWDYPLNLTVAFNNYSLNEIEIIFTSYSNKECLLYLHEAKEPCLVARDFKDLDARGCPEFLRMLTSRPIEGYTFKLLRNRAQYRATSISYSNCVKDCWDNDSFILTVEKGNERACIEISYDKNLVDIKGPSNKACKNKKQIISILKRCARVRV